MSKEDKLIPDSVSEAVSAIAKGIGVAATELWSIFVRQYLVRGLAEALTGVVLCVASVFLAKTIGLYVLIPLSVALVFFYGALLMAGNPKYYALEDISKRIKDFKSEKSQRSYY